MPMFATPKVPTRADELGKDDLLDALVVLAPIDYDPETKTKYGTSATLTARATVVDGPHAGTVEPRFYCAGNLARQIGEALDPGDQAPGRIRKGQSANGKDWYGIEWALDPADLATAEAAVLRAEGKSPQPTVQNTATPPPAPADMFANLLGALDDPPF